MMSPVRRILTSTSFHTGVPSHIQRMLMKTTQLTLRNKVSFIVGNRSSVKIGQRMRVCISSLLLGVPVACISSEMFTKFPFKVFNHLFYVAQCETMDNAVIMVKKDEQFCPSLQERIVERLLLCLRAIHLSVLFFPLLVLYPVSYLHVSCFQLWLSLLYRATERSGATFIKLGQWASTRRDLFSPDFCECFSRLHHRVRPHAWSHTVETLKEAFGSNWRLILGLQEKQEPIGSGCIAQVYKGSIPSSFASSEITKEIRDEDDHQIFYEEGVEVASLPVDSHTDALSTANTNNSDPGTSDVIPVAIKVLHPNIRETFHRDLVLMAATAKYLTKLFPKLHWVNLNQCVQEFSETMNRQLDMRHEARNLQRFTRNFHNVSSIRVPQPIPALVRRNILVETFEEGISVGQVVSDHSYPTELREHLAKLGMDLLMRMVFVDNLVHADLHPGNLLVQNLESFHKEKTAVVEVDALDVMVVDVRPMEESAVRLVLLDCGITTSLEPEDRLKFMEVFTAVVKGDGVAVADLFLSKSAVNHCTDKNLFRTEMSQVVLKGRQNLSSISKIKVAELMHEVFDVLSRHKIQLESSFATIILAIAMLEGLGRSLDPNLDLLQQARPIVLNSAFR
ncbi:uncharacterized aarF domain-containing protein kinase 2 [Aplysia californica]|uniref:Uncharacterized aarF domain-containing protein kinase 2 n=1 Tax=Aplysia californica TaxID=6500 RepID=A0ABM0K836_APLCA|nr:uncharacterized aarF domain-containing protein kinase 2 [Aplysia californica]